MYPNVVAQNGRVNDALRAPASDSLDGAAVIAMDSP
jgi:hypothetical protein